MLPGMRQVQQLLLVRAPGARGEGVQHRLPDVGRAASDQDNACLAATTQRVPKTGCQDQSGNPATGDQNGASSLHSYPRHSDDPTSDLPPLMRTAYAVSGSKKIKLR